MRKTMIRRGTGVLLALLLIVSLLPAGVLAESRNEFGIERYVALGDSYLRQQFLPQGKDHVERRKYHYEHSNDRS